MRKIDIYKATCAGIAMWKRRKLFALIVYTVNVVHLMLRQGQYSLLVCFL